MKLGCRLKRHLPFVTFLEAERQFNLNLWNVSTESNDKTHPNSYGQQQSLIPADYQSTKADEEAFGCW